MQPSHVIRYATELTNLVQTHFSDNNNSSYKPIAVVVSDGGPDNQVTFGSVKLSAVILF